MKKMLAIILLTILCGVQSPFLLTANAVDEVDAENNTANEIMVEETETSVTLELSAKSVVLMEASTGTILYEQEKDLELAPASVTKIMTLLLIFEALEEGKISLEEEVTVSEYAASMGGSQVYLEPGEKQTVETMIKCIVVPSANDACVAMAEHVAGTQEQFVKNMNDKAQQLGMEHTNFVNCNGLDAEGHLTTAYDIALMSAQLMNHYPQIQDYTMIWTENITHVTNKGSSEFELSNTNKLVRYYEYTTGLKTGYTSTAGSCISATATKNEVDLIAVVMGAPSSTSRNIDAVKLLDYGFANCQRYVDNDKIELEEISVKGGVLEHIEGEILEEFSYIDMEGTNFSTIEKKFIYNEEIKAPVMKGDVIGQIEYKIGEDVLGSVDIVAKKSVDKMNMKYAIGEVLEAFVL